jgi:hypothetical protein
VNLGVVESFILYFVANRFFYTYANFQVPNSKAKVTANFFLKKSLFFKKRTFGGFLTGQGQIEIGRGHIYFLETVVEN